MLQLDKQQQRRARGGMHKQSRVPNAGREETEQGSWRLPCQYKVAKELLVISLN